MSASTRSTPSVFRFLHSGSISRFVSLVLPGVPRGLDGLACFRFLNRFSYGNFGDPGQFGLET